MKAITSTEARRCFGKVLDDAGEELVLIRRRGKPSMSMMLAEEARLGILCAYALGCVSRALAMKRLGYTWYGQLVDAMAAANLRIHIPPNVHEAMVDDLVKVLG
jgi:hypothetical protein